MRRAAGHHDLMLRGEQRPRAEDLTGGAGVGRGDPIYGLNASVFTPDVDRARGGRSTAVWNGGHNAFRLDARIGFGGFKQSGLGREGGREGIAAYSETKVIVLDEPPQGYR